MDGFKAYDAKLNAFIEGKVFPIHTVRRSFWHMLVGRRHCKYFLRNFAGPCETLVLNIKDTRKGGLFQKKKMPLFSSMVSFERLTTTEHHITLLVSILIANHIISHKGISSDVLECSNFLSNF